MLPIKLLLVVFSVFIATWVSRRFGHRVGGIVAGFPMILTPLVGILLIDLDGERVARILWATLANQPACVAYVITAAWTAVRLRWWQTAMVGALAFALTSAVTSLIPSPWMVVIALLVAASAARWTPPGRAATGQVDIPPAEIVVRMVAAVGMAATVVLLADRTPALVSAMLLTFPINGSILPAFTQALYGGEAARALLRGFARGLVGVALFLLSTAVALSFMGKWRGYLVGIGCALLYALLLAWRARSSPTANSTGPGPTR